MGRTALFVGLVTFSVSPWPLFAQGATILNAVDAEKLRVHAENIIRHVRPGGSPGERAAIDYIVKSLRDDGVPVEVLELSAYVSDPVRCEAQRLEDRRPLRCLTQALAEPTPEGGIAGPLVDCGTGTAEDFERVDVQGKLALVEALAYPWGVAAAERAGAIAVVFSSPTDKLHELTVSTVWGTPTHENVHQLPRIPSIAISKSDGDELRAQLDSRPVELWLETELDAGFKPLRLPVASIVSRRDSDGFVLLGGHIDAWHQGANDEGASNAAMVQLSRIFHRHRDELERSLKVAWWPAHSNGRYAGSTWYVDTEWMTLRDHALAYMNVDGLGQMGAKKYDLWATPEMDSLATAVLEEVAGVKVEPERPARNSDQSFYGVGLPLLQFHQRRSEGGAGYWWWHTPEDTLDKVDFEILAEGTRVYAAALTRLLTSVVLPLDLSAAPKELIALIEARQRLGGSHLDLKPALKRAEKLTRVLERIDDQIRVDSPSVPAPELSRAMVRILRPLIRVRYQEHGPYHQDPAINIPPLPGLAALDSLVNLDPASDRYGFTRTHLRRELNRLEDHLDRSLAEAESLGEELWGHRSESVRR